MDIIVLFIIFAVTGWAFWKFVWPKGDVNDDGKVDIADAAVVVKKTTTRVKKVVAKNAVKITSDSKKTEK
jgi:hypothetical protein